MMMQGWKMAFTIKLNLSLTLSNSSIDCRWINLLPSYLEVRAEPWWSWIHGVGWAWVEVGTNPGRTLVGFGLWSGPDPLLLSSGKFSYTCSSQLCKMMDFVNLWKLKMMIHDGFYQSMKINDDNSWWILLIYELIITNPYFIFSVFIQKIYISMVFILFQLIENRIMAKTIDFSAKILPNAYIYMGCMHQRIFINIIPWSKRIYIPTIKISSVNQDVKSTLAQIRDGCKMQGIFIATDHGVPKDVIRRCEEQCKRLFFLQPDQKLSVARKPEEDGVLSSGYENFIVSDHFSKSFWSEIFKVSSSPLEHVLKNYGQRTTKYFGI